MSARILATDVIKSGSNLCDCLVEKYVTDGRLARKNTNVDIDDVEKFLKDGIVLMNKKILAAEKELSKAQAEEKNLQYVLEKRKAELERTEERLSTLMNVRPAYMDEYEVLTKELQELFPTYVQYFRNLQWLEAQLEGFRITEQKKHEEVQSKMRYLQHRYQEEEMKLLQGADITSFNILDNDHGSELEDYGPSAMKGISFFHAPERGSNTDLENIESGTALLDAESSDTPSLEMDDDVSDNF